MASRYQTPAAGGDTSSLSQRVKKFQYTFNEDMTQFIRKIEAMETTIEELKKQRSSQPVYLPDNNANIEDVQKKQKLVHTFYFKKDYTDALCSAPESMTSKSYKCLLVNLSKYHYEAAKRVWLNEAKRQLNEIFSYHEDLDEAESFRLEQIGMAYNILLSLMTPSRKAELLDSIAKEVKYQFTMKEELKLSSVSLEKCLRKTTNRHCQQFSQFLQRMIEVSSEMVNLSPPMILHITEGNLNPLWVEYQSRPPITWVRPIILKNYVGMPLVQGIISEESEQDNRYGLLSFSQLLT